MKKFLLCLALSLAFISATEAQVLTTTPYAGSVSGSSSSNSPLSGAKFNYPFAIAQTPQGEIYITDRNNNYIILITNDKYYIRSGDLAGGFKNGKGAGVGKLIEPTQIVADELNNVYINDFGNNAVRKLDALANTSLSQNLSTITGGGGNDVAGNAGKRGYEDGAKGVALFDDIIAMVYDPTKGTGGKGILYIGDYNNNCVRTYDLGTSLVATLAGKPGISANVDGAFTIATFGGISSMALRNDTLFVAQDDGSIRIVNLTSKNVSSLIKTSPSIEGTLSMLPMGNDLYLGGFSNIYSVNLKSKAIVNVAGSTTLTGYVEGKGTSARFSYISDLKLSTDRKFIWVVDQENNRIRKATLTAGVGINSIKASTNFIEVYPNPTRGHINIEAGADAGSCQLNLINTNGKIVWSDSKNINAAQRHSVDLPLVTPGVYILQIANEQGVNTFRLVLE
ncbi:MAG: T9SS type A sorting domain-containing protein [Bacteroidota bacterium]|nr:T9SS type A sorting domain-containing protein [Bacteroidota bacterium]